MHWIVRVLVPLVLLVCVNACTTVYDVTALNRQRVLQFTLGMDRSQVVSIMGTQSHSICQSKFPLPLLEGRNPENNEYCFVFYNSFLTIENPYQTKDIAINNVEYVVDYYVTGYLADGQEVSNSALTPVIFEKQVTKEFNESGMLRPFRATQREVLVGWGWRFMNQLYKGNEHAVS